MLDIQLLGEFELKPLPTTEGAADDIMTHRIRLVLVENANTTGVY